VAEEIGISYEQIIGKIIDSALTRNNLN